MNSFEHLKGVERYFQEIVALQAKVIESQKQKLEDVAARMAAIISQDGRIFIFGTGHSHMMAEEAFYRAGGMAPVVPIFSSALMLHEKPDLASRLERTEGLAGVLLDSYRPRQGEMIFIFSNSGVNRMPVEMALQARQQGLFVVSVSSLAYARQAPLSTLGKRLDEVADIAIDNLGEPGDALAQIEGTPWRVGASSTITGALIWNCLLAGCVQRLYASGADLPVFASFNMPGAGEHNAKLLEKWRKFNPHL
ncbi:MAG: SIS domain-containing protein [Anaerolineales bacterium]|nr:SIS domain-containing protein [Anaerolineales bacterium]